MGSVSAASVAAAEPFDGTPARYPTPDLTTMSLSPSDYDSAATPLSSSLPRSATTAAPLARSRASPSPTMKKINAMHELLMSRAATWHANPANGGTSPSESHQPSLLVHDPVVISAPEVQRQAGSSSPSPPIFTTTSPKGVMPASSTFQGTTEHAEETEAGTRQSPSAPQADGQVRHSGNDCSVDSESEAAVGAADNTMDPLLAIIAAGRERARLAALADLRAKVCSPTGSPASPPAETMTPASADETRTWRESERTVNSSLEDSTLDSQVLLTVGSPSLTPAIQQQHASGANASALAFAAQEIFTCPPSLS
ncbi:hypothetical protein CYMTET_2942 [Cymbomonas tetramitiformis]|uniref:Uncharacterized protein n=1 Tax=Cymbomonas tetramitiformis TaxID=36881 RepID=A0AAE0LLI0_9CHLO|nr:hypothetical protein CYMTET_2942 [Cymbomonas tetramitiformis]